MSVWESIDALEQFVYRDGHLEVMRRRREWFGRVEQHMALWWLPADRLPTLADARERIGHLHEHGPSPFAFTFKARYAATGDPIVT